MAFPTDPLQVRAEIALGADINGDPMLWSWTDVSDYIRTADGAKVVIRYGRRNDSGSTPPGTASFDLNNGDGRFCTQNPNSPYFPDLQVNTPVRLSVSRDSGVSWHVRYSGFLSALPTQWRGAAGSDSWVSVTADSVLRRLAGQPSRSALQHTAPNLISGNAGCLEYWPMEDGKEASGCASFFPDGIAMTVTGSLDLGVSSPPAGSAATAQSDYEFMKANPPSATGIIRPYTDTGEWTVLGIFKTDEDSVVDTVLMDCDVNHGEASTNPGQVRLHVENDRLTLQAFSDDNTLLGSVATGALTVEPGDGEWHAAGIRAQQQGSDISFTVRYEGVTYSFTVVGKTLGTIRKVAFPSTVMSTEPDLLAIGHLTVYDDNLGTSLVDRYAAAMNAHRTNAGELADARLQRVKTESDLIHGITQISGGSGMYERLGEQPTGNAAAILEDTVQTDGGILFEQRDFTVTSLRYRARSAINANAVSTPTLTLTQSDFAVIDQENDDHYLTTSVTVSGAGSSAVAVSEPIDNETSVSLNPRFAERLPELAGWALYQGTRRDYRYPQIRMLLHGSPGKVLDWLSMEPGRRVLIDEPPPGVVDDIDLILEGYQESMDQFSWTVDMYCSPASRYRIAELDDPVHGRMDTAGSQLINAATSSATSFDVETREGPEWVSEPNGLKLAGVAGDYASTPDAAALDITGDIDLRAEITPGSWTPSTLQPFTTKYDTSTNQRSYYFRISTSGVLTLLWSTDGVSFNSVDSTSAPSASGRLAVRVTLDVDNGAAGHDVRFYTASSIDGAWTQLGSTVTTAGVTSIHAGTAALTISGRDNGTVDPFNGVVHAVEVRNGIDGTIVADPDFAAQAPGTTSFTDSTGLVWTLNGNAAITGNFPIDVGVGGERMTATAITGSFSDEFTRSVSNGWGTSTSGHAWSTIDGVAADYSVNNIRGIISLDAVNSLRGTYIDALPVANLDRTITTRIPVLATGAGIVVRQTARWDVVANSYLAAVLEVQADQSVTASLQIILTGSVTTLQSRTVAGLTHGTGTDFRIRFRLDGPWTYMKVWGSSVEPAQWTLVAYDTQLTAAGAWGYRVRLNSGNTNTLPVALQFDNDSTLHPQRFTVTRSVNGVEKAHAAGDAVNLFVQNHLGL